ncbi:MAG: cell division protein FtsZ [Bacteroidetes bacterium]|nr:cell division protein FtsZ [Bacteroidota bacterium]
MSNFQFSLGSNPNAIIKVIGIGGAGGNAVNHMFQKGIKDVDFLVCNTDYQALERNLVRNRLQLGPFLTEGRGAGNQPEIGRQAAVETMEDFKELIGSDTKMVFITAGLGGGTGTGAAPVLAEACRALDILTVGIVTLPFSFEGKKRLEQAEDGLRELRQFCDTTLVISNDKVRELFGNLVFKEAFAKADDVLASAAKGIAEIITVDGYVNVDFADVKTVLHRSGKAVMGNGQASGENRAIEAVRMALSSPLLSENDISGARNILINLSSGLDDPIRLDEIGEVNDYVQTEAGAGTDVIWGNCTDETLGDAMRVTLIATGFEGQNNRNYGAAKGSTATTSGSHADNPSPVTVHQLDAKEATVEQPIPSELDPKEALEATRKMLEKEWTFSEPVAASPVSASPVSAEPADHSEQAWKEDQENLPLFTVIDEGPSTDLQCTVDAEPSEMNLFTTVWTLEDQPSSKSEDQGSALVEPKAKEDGSVEAEINPFFGYDGTVEWDLAVDEPTQASTPTQAPPLVEDKVQEVYATGPNEDDVLTRSRQRIQNLRKLNSLINAPGMPSLEELEKVPAYVRAGYQPDMAPGSAEIPLSRTSIGTGQGNSGIIQTGNRYLHDNVD